MKPEIRLETPRIVEKIEVIHTVAVRGKGIDGDPVREVHQYWSEDGVLLAERIISEEEETSIRLEINRTLKKGAVKLLSEWLLKEIEK